ncbi:RNA polymerase sigma factor [Pseudoblastomonas halimionae]|nr:sigma-70 family RNA polymerase sigma factor [Alteriqipengyuania halimionae]
MISPTPPSEPQPDQRRQMLQEALGQVAAGNRTALKTVYDLTSGKLYAVVVRIMRDRERAEDVLQDVYLKVWDRAGRYDPEKASVITWLCTIARNTAIDALRSDARVPAPMRDDAMPEPTDTDPLPDTLLCRQQDNEKLRRCMDELKEDQRRSIRLAFFDGLTHSELSERLEVPLGTLKSWIRRGLNGLKACLGA